MIERNLQSNKNDIAHRSCQNWQSRRQDFKCLLRKSSLTVWKSAKALLTVTKAELVETKTTDGDNVAHIAAEYNHLNIIQRLSEIDSTIFEKRNDQGFTTAGVACKNGRMKVLQWMMTNVASVASEMEPKNEKNFNSNLLFVSIMFHQADCCLWLCSEFKRRKSKEN